MLIEIRTMLWLLQWFAESQVSPGNIRMLTVRQFMSLAGMAVVIPEVKYGAGRHAAYLDPAVNMKGLKINFITQPIYLWAIPTVKISVGFFLARIAPSKYYKWILHGTIGFLLVYTFACFMTLMLQCKNLAILWDYTVETTCWSIPTLQALSYTNSGK